jgi:DNA-binding response OmpR family regulator
MTLKPSVLVVDDDREMRETLDEYLSGRGLDVSLASDGIEMKAILTQRAIDIVLLDLNLPGDNGIELTRYLRNYGNIGIIIVTGVGDPEDRVLGLETGADDYVVKPFNLRELLARVTSVLRRFDRVDLGSDTDTYYFAQWTLTGGDGHLNHKDGRTVELSPGEIDLLRVLLDSINEPVGRQELLSRSSHRNLEPFDRSIDVRIARLRKKIELDHAHPRIIRTIRNKGYAIFTDE